MTARERAEIEEVVAGLERFNMRHSASRLRALLDADRPDDERPCPVQDREHRRLLSIPWGLAEILYPAYGHDQTLERLAERGGFGVKELGMLAVDRYGPRPRLARPPLLALYEATKANPDA